MAERKKGKKKGEKKGKKVKDEISEIFEIEKDGGKKTIEVHGKEEEKPFSEEQLKKQLKNENKIFKSIVIVMIGFVLMFFAVYIIIYFSKNFEVEGVTFEIDRTSMAGRVLYKTSVEGIIDEEGRFIPGIYDIGKKAEYNFYFRKDPRQLENIPFHETVSQVKKENVIEITEDFNCNGDGIIAIANMLHLYEVLGGNIIKDANASCDKMGRYGWIKIQQGNETSMERVGPACYNLYVNNCEILDITEKFMLETLIEINSRLEK